MQIEKLYELFLQHPQVTTDSRNCQAGSMFFALRGETFDGNKYAAAALERGCAVAVVDNPSCVADDRYVLVPDALEALQQLAAHHRMVWGKPVIQITGTNGKTTTKELLSAVLSKRYNVLYTQGNLNNHIGVPLTLLRLTEEHELAVIETGANHPGEIAFLSNLVNANYGLITNVGRAHLEGFGSFEGVKQTKGELYDAMKLRGAPIFLNAFDDDLRAMAEERGFCLFDSAVPYVDAHLLSCNPFLSFEWSAEQNKPSHSVQTQLVGAYNMANLRAAVTVALHFGVEPERIDEALEEYVPTNNRSEFRKTDRNQLIVDAYNANPTSMAAALTNFSLIEAPHKMVILGEMRELGEESLSEHRKVCEQLQQLAVERIWLVGENFCKVSEQWPKLMLPQVTLFANVQEVKDTLQKDKLTDYTILVKGSNGTRLFELPALL